MGRTSKYPDDAGIYKLTCSDNGKIYIGKSVNIRQRINTHINSARHTKPKYYFQRAVAKHGWDSFTVEILETVKEFDKLKDNERLLERESYYIKLFDSTDKDKGYNICSYSTDRSGIPLSDEHREKMRNAKSRTGSKHSKETKEKLRQAILRDPGRRIGKKHSEESKAKMREARLGTKHSEATKEKMKKTRNSEEYKHCCKHKLNIV